MTGSQAKFLASAFIAASAGYLVAQSKATIPDAQVESNVLSSLAGVPELATQNIQTSTVYGTVTISGNVRDENLRTKAENLVARTEGVKKVVDQLTLSGTSAQPTETGSLPDAGAGGDPAGANMAVPLAQDSNGQPLQQQPDGTYAPAPPPNGSIQDYGAQVGNRQLLTAPPSGASYSQVDSGQRAGIPVVVPAGVTLRVRINRGIDSNHIQPGTPFDGIVLNDIAAEGAIAIPRGATVTGVVVDAQKTKALSGRGELALQLTGIHLGGKSFPLQSEVWNRVGADKTTSTVNHAVGLGAVGAVFGALAGGGVGAAVGAGVGAGVGVAGSAASPRGQILIAPESVLNFRTASPAPVQTVSQGEMQRLAYTAGPDPYAPRHPRRYYYPYGPGYPPPPGAVVYYGR